MSPAAITATERLFVAKGSERPTRPRSSSNFSDTHTLIAGWVEFTWEKKKEKNEREKKRERKSEGLSERASSRWSARVSLPVEVVATSWPRQTSSVEYNEPAITIARLHHRHALMKSRGNLFLFPSLFARHRDEGSAEHLGKREHVRSVSRNDC